MRISSFGIQGEIEIIDFAIKNCFCENSEFQPFLFTVQAFIKNNERNSEAEVRKCAQSIYDEYISVSAATQVSLTYSIQQKIQSNICQRTKKSISHTDEERQQLLKNDEKSENDDMLGNDAGIVPSATQSKRGSKKSSEKDYSENSDLRVTIRAGDGEHSKEHELNQIHAQTVWLHSGLFVEIGGRFCIRRDKKLFCWKKHAESGFRALGVLSRFYCIK